MTHATPDWNQPPLTPAEGLDASFTAPGEPSAARSPWYRRPRVIVPVVAAAVVVVALAVILPLVLSGGSIEVKGSILIVGSDNYVSNGSECEGTTGYNDLAPGARVSVTGDKNDTIATGTVTSGSEVGGSSCALFFTVEDVPTGQNLYGVEVSHRGVLEYTEAQMRSGPVLTIGS